VLAKTTDVAWGGIALFDWSFTIPQPWIDGYYLKFLSSKKTMTSSIAYHSAGSPPGGSQLQGALERTPPSVRGPPPGLPPGPREISVSLFPNHRPLGGIISLTASYFFCCSARATFFLAECPHFWSGSFLLAPCPHSPLEDIIFFARQPPTQTLPS